MKLYIIVVILTLTNYGYGQHDSLRKVHSNHFVITTLQKKVSEFSGTDSVVFSFAIFGTNQKFGQFVFAWKKDKEKIGTVKFYCSKDEIFEKK